MALHPATRADRPDGRKFLRYRPTKEGKTAVYETMSVVRRRQEEARLNAAHELELEQIAGGIPFRGNRTGQRVNAQRALALRRSGRGRSGGTKTSRPTIG